MQRLKAGHARWYVSDGEVITLQIVSWKPKLNRFLARCLNGEYLYLERTILENTYPTYRKAQRHASQAI